MERLTKKSRYLDFLVTPLLYGRNLCADVVIGELLAHYGIINGNKEKVQPQLSEFRIQVQDVAACFSEMSQIFKNGSALGDIDSLQPTNIYSIEGSPCLLEKIQHMQTSPQSHIPRSSPY
jgi:hypothetical protein